MRARRVFVRGGFAEVDADQLTVLAQRALDVEQVDAPVLAAELEMAEADLASASSDAAKAGGGFGGREPQGIAALALSGPAGVLNWPAPRQSEWANSASTSS